MTRLPFYFLALPILLLGFTAGAVLADEASESIAQAMPGTRISSTSPTVIDGLYEVVAGKNVLYVDKTGRYLVVGSIYDLKEDKDLSAERRDELGLSLSHEDHTPTTTTADKLPVAAAITTGKGNRSLTVITDPQCGWCRRLWLESLSSLEGVTVKHLILNPSEQAVGILCAKDPAKALGRAFNVSATTAKTPVPSPSCRRQARDKLASVRRFAERVGMLGTPVLIREDGQIHAGYLGRSELLTWLGGTADDT